MKRRIVEIFETKIPLDQGFFKKCFFCDKLFMFNESYNFFSKNHYCTFCLRNNHYAKTSINVLTLSFKYVFAFKFQNRFWKSQIIDLVHQHKEAGLINPTFYFDEESLLWFIDFNKIGKDKLPIDSVHVTIKNIIRQFKLNDDDNINVDLFEKKFIDAINLFHTKRYRPKNKKILCPSFKGCVPENLSLEIYDLSLNFLSKAIDR